MEGIFCAAQRQDTRAIPAQKIPNSWLFSYFLKHLTQMFLLPEVRTKSSYTSKLNSGPASIFHRFMSSVASVLGIRLCFWRISPDGIIRLQLFA
jgi:hypothetical protein